MYRFPMPRNANSRHLFGSAAGTVMQPLAREVDRVVTGSSNKRRRVTGSAPMTRTKKTKTVTRAKPQKAKVAKTKMVGSTDRLPNVIRKSKTKVSRKKDVKVSRNFKLKVNKALETKWLTGTFRSNQIESWNVGTLGGRQTVERYPNNGLSRAGYLFSAERVLHVASRCFNGKAAAQNPLITDAGMFEVTSTKVEVLKQYWKFKLRNNSQRTMFLKFYQCVPKTYQVVMDPPTAWLEGVNQGISDGSIKGMLALTNTIYTTPNVSAQFKEHFKTSVVEITMEPGQSYEYVAEGPAKLYEMEKFYSRLVYNFVNKGDVINMGVGYLDLAYGNSGIIANKHGHVEESGDSSDRLIIESSYFCKVRMPEPTGFTQVVPTPGAIKTNDQRKEVYVYDEFLTELAYGEPDRVDPIDPGVGDAL